VVVLGCFAWALLLPSRAVAQQEQGGLVAPGEQATGWARLELVAGQALHGIGEGVYVAGAARSEGATSPAALVGGAAGGLGSFFLTRRGISQGPAMAINAGSLWGTVNGALFSRIRRDSSSEEAGWAAMTVFTTAGTGLGILMASELRPRAGEVALMNSAGLWSGVLSTFVMLAGPGHHDPSFYKTILTATDVGLAGGVVLGLFHTPSRLRMLLIDVGGILGTLFGAALSIVVADGYDVRTFGACSAASTLGGLALGTFLTRKVDRDDVPSLTLTPLVSGQGGLGAMVGMRF
jgi:hypothetical protein